MSTETTAEAVEQAARFAHEVNRSYCEAIGDRTQVPWEIAPDWQRASAINGVLAHLSTPLTPEHSHESWLREKEADGWVYGPIKNTELKTHPCCVPYDELPTDQKVKDYLFGTVVRLALGK